MRTPGCSGIVMIALLVLSPGRVGGQQAPTFRASAELLTLSVVVVDRNGQPVKDLGLDDFRVTVAGAPATVRIAEFVEIARPSTAPDQPAVLPSSGAAGTGEGPDRRAVLLLFDDLSFTSDEAMDVRRTLPRLLAQFGPSDLVGFVATSGRGPVIAPTDRHELVLDALRQVDGHNTAAMGPMVIGVHEALEIDRKFPLETLSRVIKRECVELNIGPGCEGLVEAQARHQAADARQRFVGQTEALTRAVSVMGQLGAPRVIVLLSKGVADQADPDHRRQVFDDIQTLAALSGVQLYALALAGDDSDARDRSFERAQVRRLSNRTYFQGLQATAAAAGGDAFQMIGQPDRFFQRIASETSGFYRLGVEPREVIGSAATVATRVAVVRRDVLVRSVGRTSTSAAALAPASAPVTAADAFSAGVPADQFPLVVGSATRRATGESVESVEVIAEIGVTTSAVPVQLVFGLFDTQRQFVTGGQRTMDTGTAASGTGRVVFPLKAPRGSYRLRVAAMDGAGRVSLTEQPVSGLGEAEGLEWSDIVFQTNVSGHTSLMLSELPSNAPNVTTTAHLEVYAADPSLLGRTSVHFSVDEPGQSAPRRLSGPMALSPSERGGTASVTVPPLTGDRSGSSIRATIRLDGRDVGQVVRLVRIAGAR